MRRVIYYLVLLTSMSAYGIVPLEGIIFGKVRDTDKYDKFNGLLSYNYTDDDSNTQELRRLLTYQALINQTTDLQNFCQQVPKIRYTNSWKRELAIRSVIGTFQHVGLDVTVRAIAEYAKKIEMEPQAFKTLSENIVGNYCSENISVYSKKTLLQNLENYFQNESGFQLPSVKNSPFFSEDFKQRHNTLEVAKREFNNTLKNFRALCSWHGDSSNYRMLVPYLRNPAVMVYVFNNLLAKKISFDPITQKLLFVDDPSSVKVACEDLVCRKRDEVSFKKLFPRMIGSTRLKDDLYGLYCDEFERARYRPDISQPQVKDWIESLGSYESRIEALNFISLITQIPDGLIVAEKFSDIQRIFKKNIKERWDKWAEETVSRVQISQLYEEPLEIELISQEKTSAVRKGEFNFFLRMTLSEIDKVLSDVDKIDSYFNLKFEKRFLAYVKERSTFYYNRGELDKAYRVEHSLTQQILKKLEPFQKYFKIKLTNKQLAELLSKELLKQLNNYRGGSVNRLSQETVEIPVRISYGIFALQYIHEKFKYNQKRSELLTFK